MKRSDAADRYQAHRDKMAERSRAQAAGSREISGKGWVRPPEDAARREACRMSLLKFCTTYQPGAYPLKFNPDHLEAIDKIQAAVLQGGSFAMAMPRGSGKTTLCESAALWASLYGHRQFVVLFTAESGLSDAMMKRIKEELEANDRIDADFAEVTGPIRALEGIAQRKTGQLFEGKSTRLDWHAQRVVFPQIPGSAVCGSRIMCTSITASFRGLKARMEDGSYIRPDLAIIDDPQTDESASSKTQTDQRLRVVRGAILGLAGPGRSIAAIMPCTIIQRDDMAAQVLDRKKFPQWRGTTTGMVKSWPKRREMWDEYAALLLEDMAAGVGFREKTGRKAKCTKFYRKHRKEMDEGFVVYWPERHEAGEISGQQHAWNLMIERGEAAFWAEYQNDPIAEADDTGELAASPAVLEAKVIADPWKTLPDLTQVLTVFVDVQHQVLPWAVMAFGEGFGGSIVDWGAWPEQGLARWTARKPRQTLKQKYKGNRDAAIHAGLTDLVEHLLGRSYVTAGGPKMVDRILVDSADGTTRDSVLGAIQSGRHGSLVMAVRGATGRDATRPVEEWNRPKGGRRGLGHMVRPIANRRGLEIVSDANFWKTFLHQGLLTPQGDQRSIVIHKPDRLVFFDHLREHLTAEKPVVVEIGGRRLVRWEAVPGLENHWLDCLAGCCCAAATCGLKRDDRLDRSDRGRRKVSFADIQRKGA